MHGRHGLRNLALHFPFGAATVFVGLVFVVAVKWPLVKVSFPEGTKWWQDVIPEYLNYFAILIPFYFVVVGAAHAYYAFGEAQRKTVREAHLQTLLERARRDLLRTQLQPHFLFNTLHAVSALLERDVPAARRMITRLSDLLRLALEDDSRHEVSLEEEIEFLDRYAEIQKIRFGGRLAVEYDISPDTRLLLVPRLMLQPLVENSITHGLARLERQGHVTVEARRENGRMVVRVLDDGEGLRGGVVTREGVGLGNTRARLEQLYGADQSLEIFDRPGGGCEVRIELPAGTLERALPDEADDDGEMDGR
jgi:two-component system LytT family sensor kinase